MRSLQVSLVTEEKKKGANPNRHRSQHVSMTAGYESFRSTWEKFLFSSRVEKSTRSESK